LSKSTISQHLKSLRKAHLITYQEEYPYVKYALNRPNLEKMKDSVLGYYKDLSDILLKMDKHEALILKPRQKARIKA
jgi:DNA-binding transcriptional ArsR family regulator